MSIFETRSAILLSNFVGPTDLDYFNKYVENLQTETSSVERKGERVKDETVRLSKSAAITDMKFIKRLEDILGPISKQLKYDLELVENKIDFISYDKGGFFGWHSDDRETGNGRLIINLNKTVGNLEIQCDDAEPMSIYDTGGDVIIFDSRKKHRRLETSGSKNILVMYVNLSKFTYNREDDLAFEEMDFYGKNNDALLAEEEEEEEESDDYS